MNKEQVLANYRNKTTQELIDTFKGMNEAALAGTWWNFCTYDWATCAEAMVQVIKEREGFHQYEEEA